MANYQPFVLMCSNITLSSSSKKSLIDMLATSTLTPRSSRLCTSSESCSSLSVHSLSLVNVFGFIKSDIGYYLSNKITNLV